MFKKFGIVIFSVLIATSLLAGCGDKDDKKVNSNTSSDTTSAVSSNSSNPDVNTDVIEIGGGDDKVLIPDIVVTPGMEDSTESKSDAPSSGDSGNSSTSSKSTSSTSSKGSDSSSSKASSSAESDSEYYDDWEGDNVIDFSELLG